MAALLSARKAAAPRADAVQSTLLGAPAITQAQLARFSGPATQKAVPVIGPDTERDQPTLAQDTAQDRPAIAREAAQEEPAVAPQAADDDPPAVDGEAPAPTDAPPPGIEEPAPQASSVTGTASVADEPSVPPPKRKAVDSAPVPSARIQRAVEPVPSVIVDSAFGREVEQAQSVPPEQAEPVSDPPAPVEGAAKKPGFSETAWFLDALDADALSQAETEDVRDRQARFEKSMSGLDPDARRQFSLRTQDQPARLIKRDDDPARTLPDRSQDRPARRGRNDALIGLVVVVVVALGVLGWVLYGR
jgi:hypothetical protein